MTALGPRRFAVAATVVATAAAAMLAVILGALPQAGAAASGWALLGWAMTAAVGVAGGAWLVARHGKPGTAFLIAMATCMLSRLLLAGAGAVVAALVGTGAVYPYVAGLAAGFLPVQILESAWFYRRSQATVTVAAERP